MESFGQKVRRRRKQLGLTLDELAKKTGISKPYLSQIETGKCQTVSFSKVCTIESAMQMQPGDLMVPALTNRLSEIAREIASLPAAAKDAMGAITIGELIGK